jgi:signal transduction histidine kinase
MDKILVIDDEKPSLAMLRLLLGAYGYVVLTADNGLAGLEVFRSEKPPIVMTDIKMPGIDGIEVLQRIKKESQDTEVIMVTGHGDIELAIQSLKFDATDFITKPISNDALGIALKRVNERRALKAQVKEYTENLERLVEEKTQKLLEAERLAAVGQTVAGLAHAIKNVTEGLTGGMYVLETGIELDDKAYLSRGWEMVKRNINRVEGMVMDLLNYAKARRPRYQLCDPNIPLQEVFDLILPKAKEKGIVFRSDLAAGLPKAWLDPESIHRCLLDLVTNALDACSCSGLDVPEKKGEILLRSLKPEGWSVEYQVIDNGYGMDAETRNKVFQIFFTTKGGRGTGLGLMIAKKTIDEHGGVIECFSEENEGTKFVVRLPDREGPPVKGQDHAQSERFPGPTPNRPEDL